MSNKEKFLEIIKNCPEEIWEEFHSVFGLDDWTDAVSDFPEAHELLLNRCEERREGLILWLKDCHKFKDCAEKERQDIIDAYAVYLYINKGKELKDYKIEEGVFGLDLAARIREIKLKQLLD